MMDGDGNVTFSEYDRKNRTSVVHRIRIGTISQDGVDAAIAAFRTFEVNPYIFKRSKTVQPFFEINVNKRTHILKCSEHLANLCIAKSRQLNWLFSALSGSVKKDDAINAIRDLNTTGIPRNSSVKPDNPLPYLAGLLDSDGYISNSPSGFCNTDLGLIKYVTGALDSLGIEYKHTERKVKKGWALRHDVNVCKISEVKKLCEVLVPHLVIKKRAAENVLGVLRD